VSVGEYKYTQQHDRENTTRHMTGNNIASEQGKEIMTRRRVRRVAESTIQHGMEGMGR
jgi:hypothetical protein